MQIERVPLLHLTIVVQHALDEHIGIEGLLERQEVVVRYGTANWSIECSTSGARGCTSRSLLGRAYMGYPCPLQWCGTMGVANVENEASR